MLFALCLFLTFAITAQPAASLSSNRVLDLDGRDSYVELPPSLFTNDVVTVEGWVKWREFGFFSKFLSFAGTAFPVDIGQLGLEPDLRLARFRKPDFDQLTMVTAPTLLETNRWTHVAAVASRDLLKLYVNGAFASSNDLPDPWQPIPPPPLKNFLGRDIMRGTPNATPQPDLNGQMTEVRLWKGERSEAEIRETMFERLTGREPGLLGLWSFADGTANDSTTNGHHGVLMGQARVAQAVLPTPTTLAPWSRLLVRLTDTEGTPLQNVNIRAEVDGVPVASDISGGGGQVSLAFWTAAPAVDLVASGLDGQGGWQLSIPITPYSERTHDWMIRQPTDIAGLAVALDGQTPHASLVVELVAPEETTGSRSGSLPTQLPNSGETLLTPPAGDRVLTLDGQSYLELPVNIFGQFSEATTEGWVKWEVLEGAADFFNFYSSTRSETWITTGAYDFANNAGPILGIPPTYLQAVFRHRSPEWRAGGILLPDILRPRQWFHLALVTGPGGMKLYVNGVLAGTDSFTGSIAAFANDDPIDNKNFIGRDYYPTARPMTGQIDEFRIWKTARTAEEILSGMHTKLTGGEPGLVALWNFDDPANPGRDSSPNRFNGKIIGQARTDAETLPRVVMGRIMDAVGRGLANAQVEARHADGVVSRSPANADGEYAVTLRASERYDLFATDGERSAYRLGFQPTGEPIQEIDWTLTDPEKAEVNLGTSGFSVQGSEGSAFAPRRSDHPPPAPTETVNPNTARFPAGTVVAAVLTDNQGQFRFSNVKPGVYQVRAQIPGGREWLDAGRIHYADPQLPEAERRRLSNLEFQIAPFKKDRWRKYGGSDGLPGNVIGSLAFGPDDALWIATLRGLTRFDGKEFLNLGREEGFQGINAPNSMYQAPDGVIWLGTFVGLLRYDPSRGDRPERITPPGLPTDDIREVVGTGDGTIWWRTPNALVRYDGQKGIVFSNLWDTAVNAGWTRRLAASRDHVWLTGPGVGLIRFTGTNYTRFGQEHGLPTENTDTPAVGPDGTTWFALEEHGLARFDGSQFTFLTQKDGLPDLRISCLYVAPGGDLWVGTGGGLLARYDGQSFLHYGRQGELASVAPDTYAGSVCWDIRAGPDGGLWFATVNGLWHLEDRAFTPFTTADGLPEQRLMRVLHVAADGTLFAGTGTNTASVFDGRRFRTTEINGTITAAINGPDGLTWRAIEGPGNTRSIVRATGPQAVSVITNFPGLPSGRITAMGADANGAVWAGSSGGGVIRLEGTNGIPTLVATNGLLTNAVRVIYARDPGTVWAGTDAGFARFDGTNWTAITLSDGVPGRFASGIERGPDGELWFGSEHGGLSRFDGTNLVPLAARADRLAPSIVSRLLRGADGALWICSDSGVARFDGVAWVSLNEDDGVPTPTWRMAQDKQGAFWFAGATGLTRYQPARATNRPPSIIVQTDETYADLSALPGITAGRLVTFKSSTVEFRTRPNKRLYRYAVVPGKADTAPARTDPAWLPPTRSAQFEWLAPKRGGYTLFVQTIDRDLNYSTPAVAHLTIIPPWFLNAWIMVPGVGSFAGLLAWAFIARALVVRRKREADRLREQMLEQERLAKAALEQEVAERKRAEEYYQTLVETIPHIVIRKDREGRYTFTNGTS